MNNCSLLPIIIAFIFVASLPSSYSTEKYQDVGLEVHNKYRVHHKVPPLTLNENLNEIAIKCAQYYVGLGKIDHSCPHKGAPGQTGENLYQMGGAGELSGDHADPEWNTKNAVDSWYGELCIYTFGKENAWPTNGDQIGHFTQLVWKGSTELGIGFNISASKNLVVVVATYTPHGNMQGQQPENVFEGEGGKTLLPCGSMALVPAGFLSIISSVVLSYLAKILYM